MSDSNPKGPSIPTWQQRGNAAADDSSTPLQTSEPRTALLEQATKFLQDDSIRDASTDKKIEFLESKGLRSDEIDSLLGISRNAEASSSGEASPDPSASNSRETASTSASEPPSQKPLDSSASASSSTSSLPASATTPTTTTTTTTNDRNSTPRDAPPIITYPEFLVKQSKPPPLVTIRSVLYTLYGAAGLGATFYGLSEYLVKPMIADLTGARHDLAETASTNLKKLNEKLERNVSTIPAQLTSSQSPATEKAKYMDGEDDTDSITSDPTELFHRDVATQTSGDISTSSLTPNTSDSAANNNDNDKDNTTPDPTATVTSHVKRLQVINSHLREFNDSESQSSSLDSSTRTSINDLHHYLDGLLYSKPGYGLGVYGSYSTPGIDSGRGTSTGVNKGEEDAIASFKTEIRGVKGALLSARNFPSGRGGRLPGVSYGR